MGSFTSADPCPCCCPPDGKKCFQEWIASWSCDTLSWTGPVTDNRLCLPVGTSTDWVKISGDASGCEYRKYVPYDPKHCCTANGDCSGLGDTATPALPFAGGTPDDCCRTAAECAQCNPFPFGFTTPFVWTVTFDGVGTFVVKCAGQCIFGGFTSDGAALGTYDLVQDPLNSCRWFKLTTGPTVTIYQDDGDCLLAPTYSSDSLLIQLFAFGGGVFTLEARNPDIETFLGIPSCLYFSANNNNLVDGPRCCVDKTFDNTQTYGCAAPGDSGSAVATPHC